MNNDLDLAIKSAVADIVAAAPAITDDPTVFLTTSTAGTAQRRLLPAAAALLVVAGVAGLALVSRGGQGDNGPAAAEQPVAVPLTDPAGQSTAPTTTLSQTTPPATIAADESACSDGEAETTVPNVGGMAYTVAVEALLGVGLDSQVSREVVSAGVQPELGDGHVIVSQDPTAGETLACGGVVELTATTLPVYVIEPGDTWKSIAAAHGIAVEDLLEFNDSTIVELEAAGGSVTSPLEIGRVIRLSLPYRTLETAPPTTTTAPPTTG